jgi:hypothetical protein
MSFFLIFSPVSAPCSIAGTHLNKLVPHQQTDSRQEQCQVSGKLSSTKELVELHRDAFFHRINNNLRTAGGNSLKSVCYGLQTD